VLRCLQPVTCRESDNTRESIYLPKHIKHIKIQSYVLKAGCQKSKRLSMLATHEIISNDSQIVTVSEKEEKVQNVSL